jgi:enoyl-CoA hydratase
VTWPPCPIKHPPIPTCPARTKSPPSSTSPTSPSIRRALDDATGNWADDARKAMAYNSPLSMAAALAMQRALAPDATIRDALRLEYRFTSRSAERGDFLEGIRARIIDRDNRPGWRPYAPGDEGPMLAPLGPDELTFTEEQT